MACLLSAMLSTVPSKGAYSFPSLGWTAAPSPRIPWAKVGSFTWDRGTTVPLRGEHTVTSPAFCRAGARAGPEGAASAASPEPGLSPQPTTCTSAMVTTMVARVPSSMPGKDMGFWALMALTVVRSPGRPA